MSKEIKGCIAEDDKHLKHIVETMQDERLNIYRIKDKFLVKWETDHNSESLNRLKPKILVHEQRKMFIGKSASIFYTPESKIHLEESGIDVKNKLVTLEDDNLVIQSLFILCSNIYYKNFSYTIENDSDYCKIPVKQLKERKWNSFYRTYISVAKKTKTPKLDFVYDKYIITKDPFKEKQTEDYNEISD